LMNGVDGRLGSGGCRCVHNVGIIGYRSVAMDCK
jgi:hypothetical protein